MASAKELATQAIAGKGTSPTDTPVHVQIAAYDAKKNNWNQLLPLKIEKGLTSKELMLAAGKLFDLSEPVLFLTYKHKGNVSTITKQTSLKKVISELEGRMILRVYTKPVEEMDRIMKNKNDKTKGKSEGTRVTFSSRTEKKNNQNNSQGILNETSENITKTTG